jgi:hypothetical protein
MMDCPDGKLSKSEFIKIYEQLFPSGRTKKFSELVFAVIDKNKTNQLDFNQFILICSMTSKEKGKNSINFANKNIEDRNEPDSNYLFDKEEMQKIYNAIRLLYEGMPLNENSFIITSHENSNPSFSKLNDDSSNEQPSALNQLLNHHSSPKQQMKICEEKQSFSSQDAEIVSLLNKHHNSKNSNAFQCS